MGYLIIASLIWFGIGLLTGIWFLIYCYKKYGPLDGSDFRVFAVFILAGILGLITFVMVLNEKRKEKKLL